MTWFVLVAGISLIIDGMYQGSGVIFSRSTRQTIIYSRKSANNVASNYVLNDHCKIEQNLPYTL